MKAFWECVIPPLYDTKFRKKKELNKNLMYIAVNGSSYVLKSNQNLIGCMFWKHLLFVINNTINCSLLNAVSLGKITQ